MERQPIPALEYLKRFLDAKQSQTEAPPRELSAGTFPAWVGQLARIYEAEIGSQQIVLIEPKEAITVDQGARLHRSVAQTTAKVTILIADRLPTKGRGTLVRLRVPHLIGSHSVYAPELALHYRQIHETAKAPVLVRPRLTAMASSIAAYYLLETDRIGSDWTLSQWEEHLQKVNAKVKFQPSLSSLSRAFMLLMQNDLIETKILGVSKQIRFFDRALVWKKLIAASPTTTVTARVRVTTRPSGKFEDEVLFSGESALSKMSDLNEPEDMTLAMSSVHWTLWKDQTEPAPPIGAATVIEIWTGGSISFPANNRHPDCIDPIRLALSFRQETDPRIRAAIQEMLDPLDLNATPLWSQE